jgi:hypothetical protein
VEIQLAQGVLVGQSRDLADVTGGELDDLQASGTKLGYGADSIKRRCCKRLAYWRPSRLSIPARIAVSETSLAILAQSSDEGLSWSSSAMARRSPASGIQKGSSHSSAIPWLEARSMKKASDRRAVNLIVIPAVKRRPFLRFGFSIRRSFRSQLSDLVF